MDAVPHVQKVSTGWCPVKIRPGRQLGRGEWRLAGDAKPWQPEAVTGVSERLIFSHEQPCGNSRHQTESVVTMWRHVLAIYL